MVPWRIDAARLVAQRTTRMSSDSAAIVKSTLSTIAGARGRIASRRLRRTDSGSSIHAVHPEAHREGERDRYARFYPAFTEESSPVADSYSFSKMNRTTKRTVTTSLTHATRPTWRRIFGYLRSVNFRGLANFQAVHEQ